MIWIIF